MVQIEMFRFFADMNERFKTQLPDPDRTIFMWGLSKDLGLAGFRIGFLHSYSIDIIRCFDGMSIFVSSAVHVQNVREARTNT